MMEQQEKSRNILIVKINKFNDLHAIITNSWNLIYRNELNESQVYGLHSIIQNRRKAIYIQIHRNK